MTIHEVDLGIGQPEQQTERAVDTVDVYDDSDGKILLRGRDPGSLDTGTGVTYQRCGGGRRVIRKRIGGN